MEVLTMESPLLRRSWFRRLLMGLLAILLLGLCLLLVLGAGGVYAFWPKGPSYSPTPIGGAPTATAGPGTSQTPSAGQPTATPGGGQSTPTPPAGATPPSISTRHGAPVPFGTTLPAGSAVIVRDSDFNSKTAWVWWSTKTDKALTIGVDSAGVHHDAWYAGSQGAAERDGCVEAKRIQSGSLGTNGWTVNLLQGNAFAAPPAICPQ